MTVGPRGMTVGIGLPTRADALPPDGLLEWARRADAGPFTSLAVLDRVVFAAHEPLVVLAAVAPVTRRIRLLTSIVLAPTREATLLARQAASIDALSGGRLSLGVGVGIRPDDYLATGTDFHGRGRILDAHLPTLRRLWAGEALDEARGIGPIGVTPARQGGPELLIGGYVPAVARRIAAWGDGFMAPGGGDPAKMTELWRSIEVAWSAAGRPGRPRWLSSSYVALGPSADAQAAAYIRSAYAFDPALAERRLSGIPTTPQALRAVLERHAAMGVDEFVLRPCAPDPELLERLADVIAGMP
jgi:alkanesulfonate monooxygenase SsuD/methylene tetrahydromethanopterin reductase-like flavin-dependent oxidoreductase (luciferase family)